MLYVDPSERWNPAKMRRWPNRDPMQEAGGLNLYAFVGNNGINKVDIDGRSWGCGCLAAMANLAKANFRLNLLLTEAELNIKGTGLDANHIRNIDDAMTQVNKAMRAVIQQCGGDAEAAAAIAFAAALLTEAAAIVGAVAAAPAGA